MKIEPAREIGNEMILGIWLIGCVVRSQHDVNTNINRVSMMGPRKLFTDAMMHAA